MTHHLPASGWSAAEATRQLAACGAIALLSVTQYLAFGRVDVRDGRGLHTSPFVQQVDGTAFTEDAQHQASDARKRGAEAGSIGGCVQCSADLGHQPVASHDFPARKLSLCP